MPTRQEYLDQLKVLRDAQEQASCGVIPRGIIDTLAHPSTWSLPTLGNSGAGVGSGYNPLQGQNIKPAVGSYQAQAILDAANKATPKVSVTPPPVVPFAGPPNALQQKFAYGTPGTVRQPPRPTGPAFNPGNDGALYGQAGREFDPAAMEREVANSQALDAADAASKPLTRNYPEFGTTIDFPPDTTAAEIAQVEAQMNARAARQQQMQALQGVGGLINEALNYQPQYATIDKAAAAGMTPAAMQNTLKTQQGVIDQGMEQRHQMELQALQIQQRQREMDALQVNKRVDRVMTLSEARSRRQEAVQRAREANQWHQDQLTAKQDAERRMNRPEWDGVRGGWIDRINGTFTPDQEVQRMNMEMRTANQQTEPNMDYDLGDGRMYQSANGVEIVSKDGVPVWTGKTGTYFERQQKADQELESRKLDYEKSLLAYYEPPEAKRMADERFGGGATQAASAPAQQADVTGKNIGDTWSDDQYTYTLAADGVHRKKK